MDTCQWGSQTIYLYQGVVIALQIPPTVKVSALSARLAISFRAHILVVSAFCATSGFKFQIAHCLVVWLLASYLTFQFLWFLIYKISIMIPLAEGMVIIQDDHLCKVAQGLVEVRSYHYYFWYWYAESTPLMTSFYSMDWLPSLSSHLYTSEISHMYAGKLCESKMCQLNVCCQAGLGSFQKTELFYCSFWIVWFYESIFLLYWLIIYNYLY